MTWKKGQSGNPAGRAKKPRALGEQALRAELLTSAPEIIAALQGRAKEGDVAAAKVLLDRCLPPLRPTEPPATIDLGTDLAEAAHRVMTAISDGSLTPDQAAKVAATIASLGRTIESLEFEQRLSALEDARAKP